MTAVLVLLAALIVINAALGIVERRARHAAAGARDRAVSALEDAKQAADERAGEAAAELRAVLAERAASGLHRLIGRRVTLTHDDYGAIRGVLTAVYDDTFVIAHSEYLQGARPAGVLSGEVVIPRSKVSLIQRPDDAEGAA